MILTIVVWTIFGGVAGWIASLLLSEVDGESSPRLISSMMIGVLGALIGGWTSALLLGQGIEGFDVSTLILAIVGSVLLLAIFSGFNKAGLR